MKKASEYFDQFAREGRTNKALSKIWSEMTLEVATLIRERNARSDSASFAILNEIDEKWRSFARRAQAGINPDGFALMQKKLYPDVFVAWMNFRKTNGGRLVA